MKGFTRNLIFATVSVALVAFIFGTGFYFGSVKDGVFKGSVKAAENADLSSFWKVWNLLDEKFISASSTQEISHEDRVYGAIQGLVSAYDDPYTVFLPPKENQEFNESINGNFEGIGIEIGIRNNILTVVSPIRGTPAEKAGIKASDKIAEIDGVSTIDITIDEAVSMIRGEPGTVVELLIVREGESEPILIPVERGVIHIPTLETELRDDGIFVISLFNFAAKVETDFREALREFLLSRSNKLILDLRGNPGGFLDASIDISSWFLPAGKAVVLEKFGEGESKIFRSKGYNIFNNKLKMVILVDKGSASASEIVAGALQDHGVATLIGTNTFGKGSVQELIDVTRDTSLKVTIAQWLTPDGFSISDGGLTPDIEVSITEEDVQNGRDSQLEKAVEFLLGN